MVRNGHEISLMQVRNLLQSNRTDPILKGVPSDSATDFKKNLENDFKISIRLE